MRNAEATRRPGSAVPGPGVLPQARARIARRIARDADMSRSLSLIGPHQRSRGQHMFLHRGLQLRALDAWRQVQRGTEGVEPKEVAMRLARWRDRGPRNPPCRSPLLPGGPPRAARAWRARSAPARWPPPEDCTASSGARFRAGHRGRRRSARSSASRPARRSRPGLGEMFSPSQVWRLGMGSPWEKSGLVSRSPPRSSSRALMAMPPPARGRAAMEPKLNRAAAPRHAVRSITAAGRHGGKLSSVYQR